MNKVIRCPLWGRIGNGVQFPGGPAAVSAGYPKHATGSAGKASGVVIGTSQKTCLIVK